MRNSQEVQWEARQLGTVLAEIENHLPLSPAAGQAFRLKTPRVKPVTLHTNQNPSHQGSRPAIGCLF